MSVRITCINKANGDHENPYVAISRLGWIDPSTNKGGYSTRLQMYDFVEGGGEAYVQSGHSKARLITAVSPRGTRYVKTEANATEQDNLLNLPEC